MDGFATPQEAALDSMPAASTHVVETRYRAGGEAAYVLLAVEVAGTGYYLDENLCVREPDGSWSPSSGAGGGFTDRTLADLRADPPPQGLYDSLDAGAWW
jgi:hypothetical protein